MNGSPPENSSRENHVWGPDWSRVRDFWSLDPKVAHLNHGSFGAVPLPVQEEQDRLRELVEANPMKSLSRDLEGALGEARVVAGDFLHGDTEGFAFVPNATTGANTALASVRNLAGGEVLVTDQTYGAVRYAAERICRERGAKLVVAHVPLRFSKQEELVEAVVSCVTGKTRLAIVDHIASPTGLIFPVENIVRSLQDHGVPVLVDGAHGPGMVDIDLDNLGVDFWTGNFHKWCCAPRGSAGLWVREDHRKLVSPLIASWYVNDPYPSSFRWLGTDDYTPYLATPAALKFMEGLGWERIRVHNRRLARLGRDMVESALGNSPTTDVSQDDFFEAMTLVRLPKGVVSNDDEARRLQREIAERLFVETAPVAWDGEGYLRLSAQVYNNPADFERLAIGLPKMFRK